MDCVIKTETDGGRLVRPAQSRAAQCLISPAGGAVWAGFTASGQCREREECVSEEDVLSLHVHVWKLTFL